MAVDKSVKTKKILDAAVIEIAHRGYYNTTVSQIARRAGVADGTVYLYYKNKESILVSVFERAMDRFISEGILKLNNGNEPEEQIAEVVALHLELVGQDHDLAVILQVELRHSIQFMGMFSRSRLREYLEVLAGIVTRGQASGAFREDLDPLLCAKLIFGVLDQVATDWILADSNSKLASRVEDVTKFLIAGLKESK